jgi:nucleoside-diphosphate-sugar epimerase
MAETTHARFLILGGSGFLGRHLVKYLFDKKLASFVCVADKVPYQIAALSAAETAIYKNEEFCAFQQADLRQPAHVEKAFNKAGGKYDYCINLAAVTKYSQAKEVYSANIVDVAKVTAAEAAKNAVKRYIHVSTAQVYKTKKPADENTKLEPWTAIGVAHQEAEGLVAATANLNYVIVRPATCYGTADQLGLTPRLIIGSIKKELNEKMECLYSKDLRFNTVHADDVAKALHFLCTKGEKGAVYNLADKNDTDCGKVNELLEQIFGIKTAFLNAIKMAGAAAMGTKFLVGFANDEHLKPFSDACKKYGIADTPLTPYLDEELIKEVAIAVDGSKIEKLGFSYDYPKVTPDELKKVLDDFIEKKYFPKEMSHHGKK